MGSETRKGIFVTQQGVMLRLMDTAKAMLAGKNDDYGTDNFIQAATIASIITGQDIRPMDVAACLIGIKIARYGTLIRKGGKPTFESVQDTVMDWSNYVYLMERERNREIVEQEAQKK